MWLPFLIKYYEIEVKMVRAETSVFWKQTPHKKYKFKRTDLRSNKQRKGS